MKDAVIRLFGTADKIVIIVAVVILVAVVAALAGIVEAGKPPWGRIIFVGVGTLGVFAAATRGDSTVLFVIPGIIAAILAITVLVFLTRRLRAAETAVDALEEGVERRTFLVSAGLAAGKRVLSYGPLIALQHVIPEAVDIQLDGHQRVGDA